MTMAEVINNHQRILKEYLGGSTPKEISKSTGIEESQIQAILESPIIIDKIQTLKRESVPPGIIPQNPEDLLFVDPISTDATSMEDITPQAIFKSCQSQVAKQLLQEALGGDNSAARIKASQIILDACKGEEGGGTAIEASQITILKNALESYKQIMETQKISMKHIKQPGFLTTEKEVPVLEPADVK
jgi:hypothetical protein